MSISKRQSDILKIIDDNVYVSVNELAALTYTSPSSIRRDLTYLQNNGDPKETVYKLKISRALKGTTYRDTISGKSYTAEELKRGIEVKSDINDEYALMWHLIAE